MVSFSPSHGALPLFVLLCFFLASFQPVSAAIHEYKDVELPRDALMFRRSGMYGPDDAPEGKGNPSFIKVDLTLERELPEYHNEPIKVQLAVFDQQVWDKGLGVKIKNKDGIEEHVFCCTPELQSSGFCDEPLTLILQPDVAKGTYVHEVEFLPTEKGSNVTGPVKVDRVFKIPFKGIKYLLFSSCNDFAGLIRINGQTEWKNPFGYLSGELYGFLAFFSRLAGAYIVIGAIWAIACARHWKELMILQNYVTVVLALGMMEMALRYYDFAQFNRSGTRGFALMMMSSIMHTLKQTVSRLLVLVVSMGFGIVKPTLGDSFNTIAGLGGLFFFFVMVQRVYELASHTSAITFMQYVTMLPVAALDLVFFFWILRSLNDIIAQLEAREQGVKLTLYKRFRGVLLFTMLVACAWSLIYSLIVFSGKVNQDWETRWIYDGLFDILYLFILVCIMILWRPTNNSAQFAYARVTTHDADDDEEYGGGLQEEVVEGDAVMVKAPEKLPKPAAGLKQSGTDAVEMTPTTTAAAAATSTQPSAKGDVTASSVNNGVADAENPPVQPKKPKKDKKAKD